MKIEKASDMRNNINAIPQAAGIYYWYADGKSLAKLLSGFERKDELMGELSESCKSAICGRECFLIYIGTTSRKNAGLRNRLNWHINDRHDHNSVSRGTLSTFRQSISSLAAGNQAAEQATNKAIDDFFVGYESFPELPLGEKGTIAEIEKKENSLIEKFHPIINIKNNNPKSELRKLFKRFLKSRRKAAKANAIKELKI